MAGAALRVNISKNSYTIFFFPNDSKSFNFSLTAIIDISNIPALAVSKTYKLFMSTINHG